MKNLLAPTTLEFAVTRNEAAKSAAEHADIMAEPGFGKHFTDHMVDICWSEAGGWHRPRVQPYGPIQLDPAAAVLHYAQEIFEGLKAYRHADGSVWSFRPEANAARMQRSAVRLALPELPTEYFIESLAPADRGRRAVGADRAGDEPLPAALHVRQGGVPRRAPGEEGQLLPDREPGRRLLPRRHRTAVDLALHHLLAAPARAGWAPPRPAATTHPAWSRSRRRTSTVARRCSSSTPSKASTSRSSAG